MHGGARKGAGRKPFVELCEKRIRKSITAEFWVELCETVAEPLLRRLMDEDIPANVRFSVLQEILNRTFGKTKDFIDLTSKGQKLQTVIQIINPNNDKTDEKSL